MAEKYSIHLYKRPNANPSNRKIVDGIYEIAQSLTSRWFTDNVPDDTMRDLMFHDVFCLESEKEILSFLVFTSRDGMMDITLLGTRLEHQEHGLGSRIMKHFFSHARELGFRNVTVMTVPEDIKPAYRPTIIFTKNTDSRWSKGITNSGKAEQSYSRRSLARPAASSGNICPQ